MCCQNKNRFYFMTSICILKCVLKQNHQVDYDKLCFYMELYKLDDSCVLTEHNTQFNMQSLNIPPSLEV